MPLHWYSCDNLVPYTAQAGVKDISQGKPSDNCCYVKSAFIALIWKEKMWSVPGSHPLNGFWHGTTAFSWQHISGSSTCNTPTFGQSSDLKPETQHFVPCLKECGWVSGQRWKSRAEDLQLHAYHVWICSFLDCKILISFCLPLFG